MVINKHNSFYLRNGWGTKILQAVDYNDMIFSPANEQLAVDTIGIGRVMIKALRYWSEALNLTVEKKAQGGIILETTPLYQIIDKEDRFFQKKGTLLLMHRNLSKNKENATAWYWAFNEFNKQSFSKDEFVEGLLSYLAINGMNVKTSAVEKEFNCFKNTYIGDKSFDKKSIMDEDTYPFLGPLRLLRINEDKMYEKATLSKLDIPLEILVYSIVEDNEDAISNEKQLSLDSIIENPGQVGRYYNIKFSKLIEMLLEAENKGYLTLNNNFGNRYIEFRQISPDKLLQNYYGNRGR